MKHFTDFQTSSLTATLGFKYNNLMGEVLDAIRERLPDDGSTFELEENGIEDDAGNDISGLNKEVVFFNGEESYPLEELSYFDGIRLINAIQDEFRAIAKHKTQK